MRGEYIARALEGSSWAILPEKLDEILAFVEAHELGIRADDELLAELRDRSRRDRAATRQGFVAVLPLRGTLMPRANMLSEFSGGTSLEQFRADLGRLMSDGSIKSILLDVDSPGGEVTGVPETAAAVRSARQQKPIVAVANGLAASAAYWIASNATEVVASPSARVGSIGVFAIHRDASRASEAAGLRHTIVSAGRYKVEGNPFEPLGDDARGAMQRQVDGYYRQFVDAVATGRDTTGKAVREGYGEGRVLLADDALAAGMIDRIETIDAVLAGMVGARGSGAIAATVLDDELAAAACRASFERARL